MSSLDPENWEAFRALAHRALDEMIEDVKDIREHPPWQPIPAKVRAAIANDPLPRAPGDPRAVYDAFRQNVAPYAVDNRNPRFFGWVHGAGTVIGMLAALLAGGMNANAGGRDHAAIEVERRVIRWWCEVFGFPAGASGYLTTGTSIANLIGVLVARRNAAGAEALVGYTSAEAHTSLARAFDVAGLGKDALRIFADIPALRSAIVADRAAGKHPFIIIATAGSASTGRMDELPPLADVARGERLWFHVDGAFGALVQLAPQLRHLVAGIDRADSIAFDLHKWLHVPYDCGAVLVRDGALHAATFADHAPYLTRTERGTAGGEPWPTDFGPELSRSFRALGVWFTMKTYGLDRFGALIARQCAMARTLGERIVASPHLELLTPVTLNIVCFRYRAGDELNAELAIELQERGIAVLSTTRIGGTLALRMNVMNHRTTQADLDVAVDGVLAIGSELLGRSTA